jgi:hypothetical protein
LYDTGVFGYIAWFLSEDNGFVRFLFLDHEERTYFEDGKGDAEYSSEYVDTLFAFVGFRLLRFGHMKYRYKKYVLLVI